MAARRSSTERALADLEAEVAACRACPRLVAHREHVARVKRRAFREQTYWGRAVPSFGDRNARLLLVGLAPAAHGANRTGRIFTGDRSGDWLYRAMHRAGFANQPHSHDIDDGLELSDAYITATAHCAPPDNKPSADELARCRPFLLTELRTLRARGGCLLVLALGGLAFKACLESVEAIGVAVPRPRPKFAHGALHEIDEHLLLLASYHPSQQNTQTGRLTEPMLDAVFAEARAVLRSTR